MLLFEEESEHEDDEDMGGVSPLWAFALSMIILVLRLAFGGGGDSSFFSPSSSTSILLSSVWSELLLLFSSCGWLRFELNEHEDGENVPDEFFETFDEAA